MPKFPTNQMKKRMILVGAILICFGFIVVIGRLFFLQVVNAEEWQTRAIKQQLRSTTINANRGTIYDRNQKVLAKSANVWTVFISPADIKNAEEAAKIAAGLSKILEVDEDKILEKTKKTGSYYEIIKQKVEKEQFDEINQFITDNNLKGVHMEEDTKRYYPYGDLAATVLGFTGSENHGAYGLEAYYDKTLSGTPGKVVASKNAWGTDMPFRYQEMYEAKDGNSLVLTIDETIQHIVEKNLELAVIEHDVRSRAVGIVMDVNTGEILALANEPDFDPNNPNEIGDPRIQAQLDELQKGTQEYVEALKQAQYDQWRNKAIMDPYEPGSVFKIITASSALEAGVVSLNSTFYCPGYHQVGGRTIHCWKNGGHGSQNFTEAMMNSCNPAFMMIGARLGGEKLYDYFDAFGLTKPTGVDLPGEADSIYHSKSRLMNYEVEVASTSFGQTFKVTPLQLITAISASINGGKLMQPHIVKQVLDADGNIISTVQPTVKRQVISEETSATIRYLTEMVVKEGSGKNAQIPGYRIGGKTGTSEKLDTVQQEGEVKPLILSFCGIAPMDDPEIAVLVLLDQPQLQNAYGSTIAAPVVGAILQEVLPYLGIEQQFTEAELAVKEATVPYLIGYKPHDAQAKLTQLKLNTRIIGNGTTVVKQIPETQNVVPTGSTVILYTDDESATTKSQVPNVIGMTAQQANRAIVNSGFNVQVDQSVAEQGTTVIRQEPDPDTELEPGSVVTIYFAPRSNIETDGNNDS